MIKNCCMDDCENSIDTEKDYLFLKDEEGYACDTCLDVLGDQ